MPMALATRVARCAVSSLRAGGRISAEVSTMRDVFRAAALGMTVAVAGPAWGQSATELKKELYPKYKKAQADGKDLGEAGREFAEGDKALKDGMSDEAVEHFKKARETWPKDAQ